MPAAPGDARSCESAEKCGRAFFSAALLDRQEIFENRLRKKFSHLKKWARRNGIETFRVYDRDIPEIPLAADIYRLTAPDAADAAEAAAGAANAAAATGAAANAAAGEDWALLSFYERRVGLPPEEEAAWRSAMKDAVSRCLGVPAPRVLCQTRRRQRGKSQYEKTGGPAITGVIRESGARFFVTLGAYIDTGFFLEQRKLRLLVRNESTGKRVLNLFCYTCAFSVFAALGRASRVDSVDLSRTYLAAGRRNFRLNGLNADAHGFFCKDAADFLAAACAQNRVWDIVILDPPVFSNSKKTRAPLDINRDWRALVNACLDCLAPGGVLYFTVHHRGFCFAPESVNRCTKHGLAVSIQEPRNLTSEDFRRAKQPYRVWKFTAEPPGNNHLMEHRVQQREAVTDSQSNDRGTIAHDNHAKAVRRRSQSSSNSSAV